MSESAQTFAEKLRAYVRRVAFAIPWYSTAGMFRLMYGFRVEGKENVPERGPYILATTDTSAIAMAASNFVLFNLIVEAQDQGPIDSVAYMQEELFRFSYFQKLNREGARGKYDALIPHSAGRMALGLLDGYRALMNDGLVLLNPEGDVPWDGRPVPVGRALPWLALRSAAPIVPVVCSAGAYDIWPRWDARPKRSGSLWLTIGQPFRVSDSPLERVSDEDIRQATDQIQAEFVRVRYGDGGLSDWVGPPLRNGAPFSGPIAMPAVSATDPALAAPASDMPPQPAWGVHVLLWRCPVCGTNDALHHLRPRFRPQTVHCRACATAWELERIVGKDYRMKVTAGHPDLHGLDLALSAWYDQMMERFRPTPLRAPDVAIRPDEEVYLAASEATLLPHRPNTLFEGWSGREPPQTQPTGRPELADWKELGTGRLWLTSERLVWQGPQGELDFEWAATTAVYLWLKNTLGIRYGTAQYRIRLGDEGGLKWLAHAGTLAREAGQRSGRAVTVSPF